MICSFIGAKVDRNLQNLDYYWGDVLDLNLVDPNTFSMLPREKNRKINLSEEWQLNWTLKYLENLASRFMAHQNASFSLNFDHIVFSKAATALIYSLNPVVISLVPENELTAIKVYLTRSSIPGHATLDDFMAAYRHCVMYPKLVTAFFNISKTIVVNNNACTTALLNESQVEQWYKAVSQI